MTYDVQYWFGQAFYSFFAIVGFCFLFNSPRRLILSTSLTGMTAWLISLVLSALEASFILPSFVGCFFIGIVAEILAQKKKHPVLLFTVPAIVPFVPGYGIYYMMLHIIEKNFDKAIRHGVESIFIAISIAVGIMLATSLMRILQPKSRSLFRR